MKLYFLPSECQRLSKGRQQPHRLFLSDGTELKNVATITASHDLERGHTVTVELAFTEVVRVARRPKRKGRAA